MALRSNPKVVQPPSWLDSTNLRFRCVAYGAYVTSVANQTLAHGGQ